MAHQNPVNGGFRIGNSAPGEPADSPSPTKYGGFGGAPTFNGHADRGERGLNPAASGEIFPAPYGGGEAVEKRSNKRKARGVGDGTGAGAETPGGSPS